MRLQRSKKKDPRMTIVSVPSIRLMPGHQTEWNCGVRPFEQLAN